MLIIVQIILSTLLIFSIKCELSFIEPKHEQFSSSVFDVRKMFSSSSPYPIKGDDTPNDDSDGCIPIKLWSFARHGSKNPSKDTIDDINKHLVLNIQNKLNKLYGVQNGHNLSQLGHNQKQIITGIINWKNDLANTTGKGFNGNGKAEMQNLGKRLKKKCKILTDKLLTEEIEAHSAIEDRCINSGKLFLNNFYERNQSIPVPVNTDSRLKIGKLPKVTFMIYWQEYKKSMLPEDYFFKKHCSEISKRIKELLFPEILKLKEIEKDEDFEKIVKSMYYACVHSQKNEMFTNAWCKLFTFEDLQTFEAMYDIQYWYKNGYHFKQNIDYGTAITKDMLDFLENPNSKKFKLFIGHTSNMLSIITKLNLFNDEGLSIHNILDMPNRKWKTSFISPFGCNIMVIVYLCDNGTEKASILLNEVPLVIQLDNSTCVKCPIVDVINLIKKLL